jgi:Tfp pilus assembly protein PilF
MTKVMKGGALKKVMAGDASNEEKMMVLDMFISLSESEAPKGDAAEWKAQTGQVMNNYAKFLVGREGAAEALKAATNCKACHDKFKPE